MKKILTIGWKDLIILFRDRGALVLMLGAPFVLTLGLGLITGAFSGSGQNSGLGNIPVALVNEDEGELGQALLDLFYSDELADLLEPATAVSPTTARQQVDNDQIAAAVIIPAGFSAAIFPDQQTGQVGTAVAIEIYANPARPISAGVVGSVVEGFVSQVETGMTSVAVTMIQLMQHGRLNVSSTDEMFLFATEMGERLFNVDPNSAQIIQIARENEPAAQANESLNMLAYIAPGMAVAFLLYTVSLGGRSILAERDEGTLARLLVSPTSSTQILAGKVVGIFFTGVAQVSILILASSLLFGLRWGNVGGVILLILTVSAAATGWGMVLAAIAKRPGQVASYGTALMLGFGLLGGSFVQLPLTGFLAQLSKITPNAWAIQGFTRLAGGGGLADIATALLALVSMAVLLFVTAVIIFQRRGGGLISR